MSNPELFAHALTILDHPSDPMVIHYQMGFTEAFRARGFRLADFQAATGRLFARHARLRSKLVVEERGFGITAEGAEQATLLNERAWASNGLSLEEFRQLSIPFGEAPVFRFRYEPAQGFQVACHHSLMDGFGCAEFALELLGELHSPGGTSVPALEQTLGAPAVKVPLWFRLARLWILFADHLKMSGELGRHPTTLLGPARPPAAQRHVFLTRRLATEELRKSRDAQSQGANPATLNDLIVTAFHLALQDFAPAEKKPGRLSLTVPVNRRPRNPGTPRFVNGMGYVNVSTLPEHRADARRALDRVRHQMTRAKRFQGEEIVRLLMTIFETLGLLKLARRAWLKNRLPSRYVGPDAFFWKNMDTALVTNLGALRLPEPYAEWISEMYGFAPLISPSIALAIVGFRDQLHLGLRFGSSVLSEAEGARFLDCLLLRLRSLS